MVPPCHPSPDRLVAALTCLLAGAGVVGGQPPLPHPPAPPPARAAHVISLMTPAAFEESRPEPTLGLFLVGWRNRDWKAMAGATEPSWRRGAESGDRKTFKTSLDIAVRAGRCRRLARGQEVFVVGRDPKKELVRFVLPGQTTEYFTSEASLEPGTGKR